jgi:hypothetical protein
MPASDMRIAKHPPKFCRFAKGKRNTEQLKHLNGERIKRYREREKERVIERDMRREREREWE